MKGRFNETERKTLLHIARASIETGLREKRPLSVNPQDFPASLQALGAVFVTLSKGSRLRGCIGHLEAIQPLVQDVAENAFAAAFRDPRFPPVREDELPRIRIEISVLSPATPLHSHSEEEVLAQLVPGQDGVILEDRGARGTFLPSVWESLPEPRDFLRQLKRKAGLPEDYWSDHLRISRYHTESFGEKLLDA